jgi:serine/threonine protein kinase/tetratricopeptide (TPR) repeat protein
MPELVAGRYRMLDRIGSGGMGEVYRAQDRLTGSTVALKRVLVPTSALSFASRTSDSSKQALNLSLAREFRALASLRHPNIISVLDYGFMSADADPSAETPPLTDEQDTRIVTPFGALDQYPITTRQPLTTQPFFTMEYLPFAQPFDRAALGLPVKALIELTTQMLQALSYLHRHGILHRDLKPGNVLVTRESGRQRVHLVDFGLSDAMGVSGMLSGTPLFLAPETLIGQPLSAATDLYAVGIMLYEALAGHHPFSGSPNLIRDIQTRVPDMTPLFASAETRQAPGLIAAIKQLLAKNPLDRFENADSAIAALRTAVGLPPVDEDAHIRDSFLQAARFVGRDAELATLADALESALHGNGSVWLVGGESGVGKSRLLEELRTRAMVAGAVALRGQGVSSGGLPFQLWREPARRLSLALFSDGDPLSDDVYNDARVLSWIVPDIGLLIGRAIPPVPPLDALGSVQRLAGSLLAALRRLNAPALIVLEDIQWAMESLELLRLLLPAVARMPLMIVASYRDDERPNLPAELPAARLLRLNRFDTDAIEALSAAMLGAERLSDELLALLRRETEGNAFFLVETVRALASQAGRLSEVSRAALPEKVLAGGVLDVIRRRLGRVPSHARPLIEHAAVAGRQIDLNIISRALSIDPKQLEPLLQSAADAAVIEISDGAWRFSHDKLRETLLADMKAETRPALHRAIAQAIETAYPDDDDQAAALVQHWHEAGDLQKEAHFAFRAGSKAYDLGQFHQGLRLLGRAAELAPPNSPEQWDARFLIIKCHRFLGALDTVVGMGTEAVEMAKAMNDEARQLRATVELIYVLQLIGQRDQAQALIADALLRAESLGDPKILMSILNRAGIQAGSGGDFDSALMYHLRAQAIVDQHGSEEDKAILLNNLSLVYYYKGDIDRAFSIGEQLVRTYRAMNSMHFLSDTYGNQGVLLWSSGRFAEAIGVLEKALELDVRLGKEQNEATTLITMGYCYAGLNEDDTAEFYLLLALRRCKAINAVPLVLDALSGIAALWAKRGDHARAAEVYGLALSHPSTDTDLKHTVTPLIDALRPHLDAAALDAALERGKALDLDALVAQTLEQ